MNDIRIDLATEINREHKLATARADEAIAHATAAGKLLIEAKAALPHGQWLPWLLDNIVVTARQAQRYMLVAQGKPMPIRALPAKTTPVSHLEVDAPRIFAGQPDPAAFVPEPGHCYAAVAPDGSIYVVEPSKNHPGYFFVSKLDAVSDTVEQTRRPIGAAWVETNLRLYGLDSQPVAPWRMKASAGVLEALETFPGCTV